MWCVNAGEDHLDVMSRKPGAFHKNHEKETQLLVGNTVALCNSSNMQVVFTSQPIPQGSMFQVKILEYSAFYHDQELLSVNLMVSGVSVTYP